MSTSGASGTSAAGRPVVLAVAAVEYTARVLLAPQMTALQNRGFDMRLACAPDGNDFGADLHRFRPVDLRFPRSVRPAAILRALRDLREVIEDVRPDVLHLHTPAAALPSRLLPRRTLKGAAIVYTVHGFAHVWDRPSARDTALELAERTLASRTDLLLFQSREDLDEVRRRRYRTMTGYLGNGVQDDWFTGPNRRRTAPTRALFVGRLVREKGIIDLLDAVEQLPELHLTIAGTQLPTERDGVGDEVARRARGPALAGRVELLGMVEPQRLREVTDQVDFLVLPSYREGVPRSIIEGMARGRPAVVSDVRGCRELVQHGHNGLIFPPGEVRAIVRTLRAMTSMTPETYACMSEAAFAGVDTAFRESAVVDRLVDAYTALRTARATAAPGR